MTDCARRLTLRPALFLALLALLLPTRPVSASTDNPFRLVSADERGVTLEYTAPEPRFEEVETPFGLFSRIRMDGHALAGYLGQPELPERGAGVAIPEGAEPSISFEILESGEYVGRRPLPVSHGPEKNGSRLERDGAQAFDPEAYALTGVSDAPPITFEEIGRLRHHRVGQVGVRPLVFHAGQDRLTLIRRARIRVDFRLPARGANNPTAMALPVGTEQAWEETYRGAFLNYESAKSFRTRPAPGLDISSRDRGSIEAADLASAAAPVTDGNPEWRLFVARTGLYYASFAELSAKGWPAGVATAQIDFYEKSFNQANPANPLIRDIPILVEEGETGTAGVFDGDDTIYLYVLNYVDRYQAGPAITRFSNLNAYWLSWRAAGGQRMAASPGWFESASVTTPSSYVMESHYELNPYYIDSRPESELSVTYPTIEAYFWLEAIAYIEELQFQTPGRDATRPFRVRARWQGLFAGTHFVSIWAKQGCGSVPDTLLANRRTFASGAEFIYDSGYTVPGARLNDGCNELRLQGNGVANGDPTSQGSGAYFDWFDVDYHRRYVASGGTLRFTSGRATGDVEFVISDLKEDQVLVFDITDSLAPRLVTIGPEHIVQTAGPPQRRYELRMRAQVTGGQRTYLLHELSSIPLLTTAVAVNRMPKDQGTTNLAMDIPDQLTTDTGANALVIVPPEFRETFAPWKALRESQGYRMRVATPQDIYDQFNGGVKSPFAIRQWLRHVYRNWAVPPDMVVLIGDGNEDHRSDVTANPKFKSDTDWIPTMMSYGPVPNVAQRLEKIGTDHWYIGSLGPSQGDFDILPEMFIGRITVSSVAEAQVQVDKLVNYDNYSPSDTWRNRGLIVSDDQFSSPLSGFSTYGYQSGELIFEEGGDSLSNVYSNLSCYTGFSVDHFRLDDYLTALNRPKPPCPADNRTCQASASAAQAEARRTATPAWVQKSSEGHLFQIFSGHANSAVMATELFVEFRGDRLSPDARITDQLTNYGKPFIFIGVACHLNEFESYNEGNTKHCLSESMLLLPNRGAIASIASTGFEWLPSNKGVELYLGRALFADHPRDPVTGRPRRILGEATYTGLVRLVLELGVSQAFLYRETIRSYGLLGDPLMRIDMAPPVLSVTVDGQAVEPNATIRAAVGQGGVTVRVKVADDVDDRVDSFAIQSGGTAVPASQWTATPFQTSDLGACHGVTIDWPATIQPANYTINLTGTDWIGRTMEFPLRVEVQTEFKIEGRTITPNELLPTDVALESCVILPVEVTPGAVRFLVNGESGYFNVTEGIDAREWLGTLTRTLPSGTLTIVTMVHDQPVGSFQIRTQAEFGVDAIYFYPSPWNGVDPAYFTYQLSYLEGGLPRSARVSVYSVSGRKVVTIEAPTQVGRNTLAWNVTDEKGDAISNGVYLYKLTIEDAEGRLHTTVDRLVVHR